VLLVQCAYLLFCLGCYPIDQPFDQSAPTGHVYVSDGEGLSYSLSLPYNHRSADGKCDFEKVEGLEGIYLANFIDDSTGKRPWICSFCMNSRPGNF